MHSLPTLYNAVNQQLIDIDTQIQHIKNDIKLEYPVEDREKLNVWYWTRGTDGKPVLQDLLVARAQCISAMANLRVEMSASRRK